MEARIIAQIQFSILNFLTNSSSTSLQVSIDGSSKWQMLVLFTVVNASCKEKPFCGKLTHNFLDLNIKSPVGFYFLGLALAFFIEWLKNKDRLYIGLFLGPILSFLFIFGIWLGTYERILVFTNIHRYLTHSSIFISFFIGSLIVLLCKRLNSSKKYEK